ncbi:MAG: hypothetical protein H0U38_03695, partial [Chloroflexia bacterium]|nr:hypothetical protein [Chloroflexia bacterium]
MKRLFTVGLVATMLLTVFGSAQAVTAQDLSGDDLCDVAIAQSGTGQGQFGRYSLVQAPAMGGSGSQVVVGTDGDNVLHGGSGNDLLCRLG